MCAPLADCAALPLVDVAMGVQVCESVPSVEHPQLASHPRSRRALHVPSVPPAAIE